MKANYWKFMRGGPLLVTRDESAIIGKFTCTRGASDYNRREIRTTIASAREMRDVLTRLVQWSQTMGGFESPVWSEAAAIVERLELSQSRDPGVNTND